MQLRKAERKQAKIRLGLSGPSGSGKTYSALLIASGLTDWDKIAVIDSERRSADLYSDLGPYNVLPLDAPYSPERYIEAIKECENAGMDVIIVDSMTHEWDGVGGMLNIADGMTGNNFTNWAKLTPRHNKFIEAILESKCHVICTLRSKQDYVLEEKNGKQVPKKVGLKAITREGVEYEFTLVFDLDIKHNANSTKDRTKLFMDKPEFVPSADTGKKILEWCNSGKVVESESTNDEPSQNKPTGISEEQFEVLEKMVENAETTKDLTNIWNAHKQYQGSDAFKAIIKRRRAEIEKKETKPQPVAEPT